MVQVEQSVGFICVYVSLRTIAFELIFDLDIWHVGSSIW